MKVVLHNIVSRDLGNLAFGLHDFLGGLKTLGQPMDISFFAHALDIGLDMGLFDDDN